MATVFDPAVRFLADLGVFEVLIPFMLSFTLVYAILQKTQVLGVEKNGSPKKNINTMIAFAVSFIFVASLQLVSSAVMIAQYSAIALLGMIALFTVAKLSGHGKWETFGVKWPILLAFLLMAVVAITALGAWGWFNLDFTMTAILPTVIVFATAIGFIWYVTKDSKFSTAGETSSRPTSPPTPSTETRPSPRPAELPPGGLKPAFKFNEEQLNTPGEIWKG